MRRIIVTEFLTLDGVMENPQWSFPYWGDDIAAFKGEETANEEPILLGRKTYEGFAEAWPSRTDEASGGRYFNSTRKYVVSTTLENPSWNNSQVIGENIIDSIRALKQEDGPDIVVHGSGTLVRTLLEHNLVDRLRLLIYPVVVGSGMRLFENGMDGKFRLIESRRFDSGVVGVVYEPVGNKADSEASI